ncbi:sensor histidine kinase [Streptomyces kronopolitis]|uniref:sensor histidine kinase n=1 Tax=Streptomyces kronopolitis TaxID=1612435 RepID=UPI0036B7C9E8
MAFTVQRGWAFSREEYAPALIAAMYNITDVASIHNSGLVTGHVFLASVGAFFVGALMVFRLRLPRTTTLLAVIGDWVVQAPGSVVVGLFTTAQIGANWCTCIAGLVIAFDPLIVPILGHRSENVVILVGNIVARTLLYVLVPIMVGRYSITHQVRLISLTEYTRHLEHEQQLLTERAQVGERNRIASELHDVVAHRVTHVIVHAGALKLGSDRGPQWVAEKAELIRNSGVQALEELRALLGVLQPPGGESKPAPLEPPAVRAFERLVEGTRAAGSPVELDVQREVTLVPVEVRRAVYYIVREALTNAVKYAPEAAIAVKLHCTDSVYSVRVSNAPSSSRPSGVPGSGHGLVGLQQRVQELGGTFSSELRDDGGFAVEAIIPFSDPGETSPDPKEGS